MWVQACVSKGCVLGNNLKNKFLCSDHFTCNDFEELESRVRRRLKKEAVPSRFSREAYMFCIACNNICDKYSTEYLHE